MSQTNVFITGHGDVPMAVSAMKAGASDFVQKPFRDQDLIDRIAPSAEYSLPTVLHLVVL